ncbi:MAG: hypothetical protein HYW51_02065 [Candidatus Doudnabacteria bacterium]|nr:hypothetical protein [Candidatus Doudnabacteria bacterium]
MKNRYNCLLGLALLVSGCASPGIKRELLTDEHSGRPLGVEFTDFRMVEKNNILRVYLDLGEDNVLDKYSVFCLDNDTWCEEVAIVEAPEPVVDHFNYTAGSESTPRARYLSQDSRQAQILQDQFDEVRSAYGKTDGDPLENQSEQRRQEKPEAPSYARR